MPDRKSPKTDKSAGRPESAEATPGPRPGDVPPGDAAPPDRPAEPAPAPAEEPAAAAPADAGPEPAGTTGRPDAAPPADAAPTPGPHAAEPHAAEPHAADDHESHEEHGEEPAGRSFAATALIVLLLLIAGAGLGIWGGPQLAPHLPSGLAPVAAWLTPGAEARIAALEAETGAALAELRSAVDAAADPAAIDARLDARLDEAEAALAARIDELGADVAALDGAETRERLARLEAELEGQTATLASLREQLAAVDDVEAATAQIDVYVAELEGVRAELRDVAGQVGTLGRRIDEVAAAAARQIDLARAEVAEIEARSARALGQAEIEADLALIRAALASGAPYEEAAERLAAHPGLTLPEGLAAGAGGVPTLASLRDSFPDAAHAAIRAGIMADAGDGFLDRARAFAEAQVASRSLEPRPGPDPDAVLSRMEDALRRDDLDAALAEAEALPSEAAAAMAPWLAGARARAAAVRDYAALEAELSAMN